VGEARDVGYLRLKAPLDDAAVPTQFDGAMAYLAGTRGLILDLREATGPFRDSARARATLLAILNRFVAKPAPWQARESRAGERVVDFATPHATPHTAPLVVLVDRWTAGEGEALAVGLQAAAGARLVGTRMAGLRGELREARLPRSRITLRFPAEKAFRPDGTPRESVVPDVFVDLAAPKGGPGDPILYQGLKLFEK
jgi:carboxyl-terminal processing protease